MGIGGGGWHDRLEHGGHLHADGVWGQPGSFGCVLTSSLQPTKEDVEWVLQEVNNKLSDDIQLQPEDVRAAWAGIRPLVRLALGEGEGESG